MESTFIYMVGYGLIATLFGLVIGWLLQLRKLETLSSDLEIKNESYQALKRQYDTNISNYESLHHSHVRLEEKMLAANQRIHQFELRLKGSDTAPAENGIIDEDLLAELRELRADNRSLRRQLERKRRRKNKIAERKQDDEVVLEEVVLKDKPL